jgi:hypothetical protein
MSLFSRPLLKTHLTSNLLLHTIPHQVFHKLPLPINRRRTLMRARQMRLSKMSGKLFQRAGMLMNSTAHFHFHQQSLIKLACFFHYSSTLRTDITLKTRLTEPLLTLLTNQLSKRVD